MIEENDAFDKEAARVLEKVKGICADLREHCDSVIIICSISEGADSQMLCEYKGNFYAVMGTAQRFTERIEMERKSWDAKKEQE